jgi:hypothetical protein
VPEQRRDGLPLPTPIGAFSCEDPFATQRPENTFLDVCYRKEMAALDKDIFDQNRIENPGDTPAAVRLIDDTIVVRGLRDNSQRIVYKLGEE